MIALCVDDEALLLRALQRAVMKSPDIEKAVAFDDAGDALECAKDHEFDIAFLDIRMPGMEGLELAEKLRQNQEHCAIVFCTGHTEYAISAINMHLDCGYLTKPIEPELVQREISRVKQQMEERESAGPGLTDMKTASIVSIPVKCYGGFEVLDRGGQPLVFRRSRAKELFALLIYRRGMGISAKTICSMLFEDDNRYDLKNMNHFYKLIGELKRVLDKAGYYKVIKKNGSSYYVDSTRIIIKDEQSGKAQGLEYMEGYSWRE